MERLKKKPLPLVQKQKFHCNYKITLNISFGENIDILVLSLPQTIPLNPMLKLARFFCVNLKVPDFNLLRHGHFLSYIEDIISICSPMYFECHNTFLWLISPTVCLHETND